MGGTVANAGRWAEVDVWSAPAGTAFPATIDDAPATGWDLVGFMDGSAGVVKALDEDSDTLKAWGGTPIEIVSTFNGESFTFTAVEDNDVVWNLIYQGSDAPVTASGVTTRTAKVPKRVSLAWIIELRNGTKKKQYRIAKGTPRLASDITENETDLGGAEITVSAISNDTNELHDELIKGYTP